MTSLGFVISRKLWNVLVKVKLSPSPKDEKQVLNQMLLSRVSFVLGLSIMGGMECLLASLKLLLHISLHLNGAACRLSFSPTIILYFLLQSNQPHPRSNAMWRIFVLMNFIFIAQTSTYFPAKFWRQIFTSFRNDSLSLYRCRQLSSQVIHDITDQESCLMLLLVVHWHINIFNNFSLSRKSHLRC